MAYNGEAQVDPIPEFVGPAERNDGGENLGR